MCCRVPHTVRLRCLCAHYTAPKGLYGVNCAWRRVTYLRHAVFCPLSRRGKILLTPDERSVIWGGECIRYPLRGALNTSPEALNHTTAERPHYS